MNFIGMKGFLLKQRFLDFKSNIQDGVRQVDDGVQSQSISTPDPFWTVLPVEIVLLLRPR
jgi:hypothetical protein